MPPKEINPVTRTRLWYIAAFLILDGIVALYVSAIVPPTESIALYAILFGMVQVVAGGAVGSFLIATRKPEVDLRASRPRT